AIGDSVMLSAASVLRERGYYVDAAVSRQMIDMIPIMEHLGEAGVFGSVVVVHLGTNGPIEPETLNAFLAPLSQVPNVILINNRVNRAWTATNNTLFAARDKPGDNIIVIDWYSSGGECGGCFAADGYHLNIKGANFYADLIGDVTGISPTTGHITIVA